MSEPRHYETILPDDPTFEEGPRFTLGKATTLFQCMPVLPGALVPLLKARLSTEETIAFIRGALVAKSRAAFDDLLASAEEIVTVQTLVNIYEDLVVDYSARPLGRPRSSQNGQVNTAPSSEDESSSREREVSV